MATWVCSIDTGAHYDVFIVGSDLFCRIQQK